MTGAEVEPVDVVTVTYSPGPELVTFLDSLHAATVRQLRVVLADNGSTDGAPEAAAQARADVELLATGGNLGYGQAANLGVARTSSEFVVIANPDVKWEPGALDALLAATRRWPRAATFGPLIRTPDGSIYPSARNLPELATGIGHALFGWCWPTNPWTVRYRRQREARSEGPVGWLSGSCLLIRRTAFDEVDGFDPSFFMYFEDTDLGDRLGQAGWMNVYIPSAEVVHIGGHSTRHRPAAMLAVHHRSAWLYLSRRYGRWYQLPVRVLLRVGLAARSWLAQRAASRDSAPQERET